MSHRITRKELFRSVFSALRGAGGATISSRAADSGRLLRPPGASATDSDYLAACTGCEACIPVCPPGALFMALVDGDPPRRVAVISPEIKPCYLCTEISCSRVCEPGALRPLAETREVRIGVAQIDPFSCRTFREEACDLCVRICPFPDEAIHLVNGRPVVVPQHCTGCGLCVMACPETPGAVLVVPERDLIPGVRLPLVPPRSAPFQRR